MEMIENGILEADKWHLQTGQHTIMVLGLNFKSYMETIGW